MTQAFTCPNCSAPLTYDGKSYTITCKYCHTPVIVPQELRAEAGEDTPSSIPADLQKNWAEINELALTGKKLEAIKRMRETFEVGLKEAKEAIESIEQGQTLEMSSFQVISTRTPGRVMDAQTTERIRLLLAQGNKMQAIKTYMEVMGSDLKQAVDAIDAMELGFKALDMGNWQEFQTTTKTTIDRATARKIAAGAGAATASGGCLVTAFIVFMILVTVVPILIAMASSGGPLNEPWARINPFGRARLVTSFGGEGTGSGLFQDARYVATDNNGHLFVGEYDGGRIHIFDTQGKFLGQWTPVNEEDYDLYLRGMAVDRSGMMYLAAQGKLYVYNALSGERLGEIPYTGEYGYFDDVFIGPDGTLYATDTYNGDNILHFDRNRQMILSIPNAISSVTDESESTIRLSVDGLGTIYALGDSVESIFVFAPDGRYVTRFGSEGEEKGQFTSTYAIAVDNQSRVYVSDFGGLQVFSSDGRYLYKIGMPSYIYGIVFTDDNHLITVDGDDKVRVWEIK
jgi:ribosomal protein L7/L12/sugar lactone lactonase YvrE